MRNASNTSTRSEHSMSSTPSQVVVYLLLSSRLLDEAAKQNSRMRQQLQRIATEFRDFAHVQKQLIELLKMPFPTVPPEMFDAISHDPAGMTGTDSTTEGVEDVEEVHCRINRQREMLSSFAAALNRDQPINSHDQEGSLTNPWTV
jgi:hypothetical protein